MSSVLLSHEGGVPYREIFNLFLRFGDIDSERLSIDFLQIIKLSVRCSGGRLAYSTICLGLEKVELFELSSDSSSRIGMSPACTSNIGWSIVLMSFSSNSSSGAELHESEPSSSAPPCLLSCSLVNSCSIYCRSNKFYNEILLIVGRLNFSNSLSQLEVSQKDCTLPPFGNLLLF